ncbi:hypothetical protein G6F46_015711 [Rhizopus delemar]|nr:hypothetical protein G6F46_015711 [Rhizopus delemar]
MAGQGSVGGDGLHRHLGRDDSLLAHQRHGTDRHADAGLSGAAAGGAEWCRLHAAQRRAARRRCGGAESR